VVIARQSASRARPVEIVGTLDAMLHLPREEKR